jgi:hypothetical protein
MSELFLEVKATTVPGIEKRYSQFPTILMRELEVGMNRCAMRVNSDAQEKVKRDTGDLRRRLTRKVFRRGATEVVGEVGAYVPHARPVEFGRRAGAPMPPLTSGFMGWLRRRGLEEFQYVIRRSIGRRGIPPAPYLIPALKSNRDYIRRELGASASQRALAKLRSTK